MSGRHRHGMVLISEADVKEVRRQYAELVSLVDQLRQMAMRNLRLCAENAELRRRLEACVRQPHCDPGGAAVPLRLVPPRSYPPEQRHPGT